MAMIGVYASFFGLFKLKSAFSAKPPVPKAAAPVVAAAGGSASKWGFEPVSASQHTTLASPASVWESRPRACRACSNLSRAVFICHRFRRAAARVD